MVKGAGFHKDVATHGRWVKNGHDLSLKGNHRTAAVEAGVHFVSHTLFGVDGGLHDVEERADAAVHLTEQAVGVFHVEVGENAVVILDGTGVDPFCTGVDAGGGNFFALGDDQNGHHVHKVAAHVNSTLGSSAVVVEVFNGDAGGLSHTVEDFLRGVSDAPNTVPKVGEVLGGAVALQQQQFLFKSNKGYECFRHVFTLRFSCRCQRHRESTKVGNCP